MCTIKSYDVWFLRCEARHAYSKRQILGFLRLEIHKKSTKNKRFQWAVPVKTSWTKKYKFNLYFTFKIINIDNRSYRKLFLFKPSFTNFFIMATYQRFSTGPAQTRKQSAGIRTCFSFKIKDQNNLIWVGRHTKNNLRLFKLDSKTLLACHAAMMSTKWGNIKATSTLTLLEDISIKIIGRGFLQSYIWLAT